jgi:hypothetical protein
MPRESERKRCKKKRNIRVVETKIKYKRTGARLI